MGDHRGVNSAVRDGADRFATECHSKGNRAEEEGSLWKLDFPGKFSARILMGDIEQRGCLGTAEAKGGD